MPTSARRLLALAAGAALALTGLAAPAAHGAGFWGPRLELASTQAAQSGEEPFVAVGPDLTTYVAYRDGRGVMNPPGRVAIRTRSPGGVFSPDGQLAQSGFDNQSVRDLTVAPDGTATVMWANNAAPFGTFVRRFSREGVLGPAAIRLDEPTDSSSRGRVASDAAGNTLAALVLNGVAVLRRVTPAGVKEPIRTLGTPGDNPTAVELGVAADGTAFVVWLTGGPNSRIQLRTVAPSGALGPVEVVASNPEPNSPSLSVTPSGQAVIAFTGTDEVARLRVRRPDGSYGPVETLSAPGARTDKPVVGTAADGSAAIVWTRISPTAIQGRRRSATGAHGPIVDLAPAATNVAFQAPRITVERDGNAAVIWNRMAGVSPTIVDTIEGRGFRADGGLDPTTTLSDSGSSTLGNLDVANDGFGNVAMVTVDGGTKKIDGHLGDFGGPEQRSLVAPARVERAVPATFSFTPVEKPGTSTVAASRWIFSDNGEQVPSSSATHTFQKAGAFTARSVTVDGHGNVRDAANPVQVVDTRVPVLSGVSLARSRFRLGKKGTAVSAQRRRARKKKAAARGTRVRLSLNEDARVAFSVQRRTSGRRVGRSCRAVTRKNRKRRRCVRFVGARGFTFARQLAAGRRSFAFSGRVGRRKLGTGRYRFTIVARDPSGNGSRTVLRAFRVVRR